MSSKIRLCGLFVTWLVISSMPGVALAQNISIESSVNINRIPLGSAVNLTITIKGTQNVSAFDLPPIEGFDVKYIGPSRNISVINNQYTTSVSFTYSLMPLKAGKLDIPVLQIALDGKTYQTKPIVIEVYDPAQGGSPGSEAAQLSEKIFVKLQVPKEEVYLNEPVSIKVFLYTSGVSIRDIQYPKLDLTGFSDEPYDQPRQYQQVIEGKRFEIVEFEKVIYPTRTGALTLGPAQVDCNIVMKNRRGSSGGIGQDDFFSAFFDRGEKRPAQLLSEPVTMTVKDVPAEGRPESFTGGVGNLDFDVDVSPTDVNIGDPITLKMKIQGRGNLSGVAFPKFELGNNFKIYDPIIKDEGRVKLLEQVLIPTSTDIERVPEFKFSYYNINLDKYVEINKGPFPINVSPAAQDGGLTVVGLGQDSIVVAPEQLGEDIVYIKDSPGKFLIRGKRLYNSTSYYVVLLLLIGGFVGGYVWYRITHRMETDSSFARRLKAPKEAKRGLVVAKELISEEKNEQFYDHIYKLMQRYVSGKLTIPAGMVNYTAIKDKLSGQKIESELLDDLKRMFDECDSIRYASAQVTKVQMNQSYQRVEKIIDYFERRIK